MGCNMQVLLMEVSWMKFLSYTRDKNSTFGTSSSGTVTKKTAFKQKLTYLTRSSAFNTWMWIKMLCIGAG